MRIVIGLILEQGIIRADSEAELDRKARAAYRDFRRRNFHTFWRFPEAIARWLRDRVVGIFVKDDYSKDKNFHDAKIQFIGLWDTVAAYGMPIEEMTRGISQWIFPLLLPECRLDKRVVRACHALSIDDERTTFHPVLWDERYEEPLRPRDDGKRYLVDERISQVWFAGVHSNVGGGYPDDSLAQIPLIWIMSEAEYAGLAFKQIPEASPQTLGHPLTAEDKDGRLYDPRSGLGGYYRYGPRNLFELGKEMLARKGGKAIPKIHESVLQRIKNNAHLYAPKGLPAEYDIVASSGEVLPSVENPYESPAQAHARANIQEKAWNTIWLRRIVYFLTVGVSVYLAAFPLLKALPRTAELESPLRWVSDAVELAGEFLPGAAAPWIRGHARDPAQFLVFVFVLSVVLWWGSRLARRIDNNMGLYWAQSLDSKLGGAKEPTDLIYRLRTSKPYRDAHYFLKRYAAPAFFALLFVYLGLALTNHALYVVQDDLGWVCKEADANHKPPTLEPDKTIMLPDFQPWQICQSMHVWLEQRAKYRLVVEVTKPFRDGDIDFDASKGFYFSDPPRPLQKSIMFVAVPLRRELIRPWFRIVARIGGVGGEETFLDPDPESQPNSDSNSNLDPRKNVHYEEPITATRDGELFLFVNDAVLAIPGHYGYFYRNNTGTAKVTITRTK